MFVRCLSLWLALVLAWSGLAFHEVHALQVAQPGTDVVLPGDAGGSDRASGSVDDHHLDDTGTSAQDLPDQHAVAGTFLLPARLTPSVTPIAAASLRSPHLLGVLRPPRAAPFSA